MRKNFLTAAFVFAMLCAQAGAEIVIEKLEDPPYLNPDGTIYEAEKEEQNTIYDAPDFETAQNTVNKGSFLDKAAEGISNAQLSRLERKVFARNYIGDTSENRLKRLERSVFGASQRGDTINRLKRLTAATKSYTNNYAYQNNNAYNQGFPYSSANPYANGRLTNKQKRALQKQRRAIQKAAGNGYYNSPYDMYAPYRPYKNTGIKEFLKVFTGGTLTGFSPSPSPYNFNQNGFSNGMNSYYNQPYNSPYSNPYGSYNPYHGRTSSSNYMDLFSNGASGSEMYYDDGQYRRNINSTGGGCGVKVIY